MKTLFKSKSFHYQNLDEHIREVSKYELLRQYLPFLEVLSDRKTIITKNNSLIRVIKIAGFDSANLSGDEQQELFNIRKNLFSFVPAEVKLNFYTLRRRLQETDDEDLSFSNQYADKISKEWNTQFKDSFVTEIFLVITRNFPEITKDLSQFEVKLNSARKEFGHYVAQIHTLLNKFGTVDLDNHKNHELFKFFSYLINCYEFNSKSEIDLFSNFSLSDISFNTSTGLIKVTNDRVKKFTKVIGVRVNNNFSDENLFNVILTLPYEFTIIQQIKNYTKEQNRNSFKVKIESLAQLPKLSSIQSRIEELAEAGEAIETNQTNFHDYSCYIKISGNSEEELESAVSEIQNTLATEGVTSVSETIGVILTFFSLLPDMDSLLTMLPTSIRSRITTQNISDFVSLSSTKEGFRRCPFGEYPVVDFKTFQNTNYSFTFHQDDIDNRASGHTMVIGGTSSGKSTLMAFLLMNCLKFQDIKILCFDSLQGLKLPITVFDGKYITVGKDTDLKLNPMTLPDSYANRNFQEQFIGMLSGGIDEKESDIVSEVIRQNYNLDLKDRSLRNLRLAFDIEGYDTQLNRQRIASRIKKWVEQGDQNSIHGDFFNSSEDNLNFSSNIVCFDMGEVLKDAELLAPISSYIFHKFNQIIGEEPSPHIFFIDEMQRYLQSENFNPNILRTIKESRKRNGIFVGCMQEASTLVDSKNGDEIIANLATLIIFPNAKARPEHYIDKLNLTDSEFDFVKTCANPRAVLIKKKHGHSVIVNVDLSILGKHLKLFSSQDTDRKVMEGLIKEGQEDNWIPTFLGEGE